MSFCLWSQPEGALPIILVHGTLPLKAVALTVPFTSRASAALLLPMDTLLNVYTLLPCVHPSGTCWSWDWIVRAC